MNPQSLKTAPGTVEHGGGDYTPSPHACNEKGAVAHTKHASNNRLMGLEESTQTK